MKRRIIKNKEKIKKYAKFGFCLVGAAIINSFLENGEMTYSINYTIPHEKKPKPKRKIYADFIPTNSMEESIFAISNSAKRMDFDSNKICAAQNICEIVKNASNDSAKRAAAIALNDIVSTMDFDSNKLVVTSYISDMMQN